MGFLESFLDALGRSGLLPEASRTLKHYACNGFSAPQPGHDCLRRAQQLPEEGPQKQYFLMILILRILRLLITTYYITVTYYSSLTNPLHASRLKASAD